MAVGSVQVTAWPTTTVKSRRRDEMIAVQAIHDAVSNVRAAENSRNSSELALAQDALHGVVRTARFGDTSWEVIAGALGISRDTAYNRFRRQIDTGDQPNDS